MGILVCALVVISLGWGSASPAGAAPAPPAGVLSLRDLEVLAASRHPLVKEAQSRCRSLASRKDESRHRFGPEFQAGYNYNTNPVFSETDRSFSSVQHHAEAGVVLPVLKRLGAGPGEVERAACQLQVAEAEGRRALQEALFEVRQLYLEHWEAEEQERRHRSAAALLEEAVRLARRGEKEREVLPAEVLALEHQWLEAREQAALAARVQENRRRRLATLLGLDPGALHLAPHTPARPRLPGFAELVRLARNSRPELAAVPWRVREARINGERAVAQVCDLNLEARYYVDQYKDLGTRSGAFLMARFTAPLEAVQLVRHRRESSQSEAAAQEARGEALALQVEREVAAALERYQAAEARLRVAQTQRRLAEEQLRARTVMAAKPSLLASASGLEVLSARVQAEAAAREEAAREAERERAYAALLLAVGTDDLTAHPPATGAPPSPAAAASPPLAVWLYYPDRLITSGELGRLPALAREKGLTAVYLCLNRALIAPGNGFAPRLREFLAAAHRQGMAVHALLDETTWLLPERRDDLLGYLRWLREFQAGGPEEARFRAVHLDLEIHQLPRWRERRAIYAGYLLETLRLVRSQGVGLPVWLDVPVWLEEEGVELWPELLRQTDGVVFMAYEQTDPQRLAASLTAETALLSRLGKPYWVGVQVRDFAGEAALRAFLARLQGQLKPPPAGFALFQYEEVKKWR
jgi:outer membrane protein TolC